MRVPEHRCPYPPSLQGKGTNRAPRGLARVAVLTLALVAVVLAGHGSWIYLKAGVAQLLLQRAWALSAAGTNKVRPWPWADTYPAGRLRVPEHGIDQIVLAGTTGRTLAFAPGHVDGTDLPGHCGSCVLSGHRDTHFAFVRNLRLGDEIDLQAPDGDSQRFRVTAVHILHESDVFVLDGDDLPMLTLITCYPFDAVVPGGPLRYVVWAEGS